MKQDYSSLYKEYSPSVRTSVSRRQWQTALAGLKPLAMILPMLFLALGVMAQSSTINTLNLGTGYNGSNNSGANSFITFGLTNNSGMDMRITEVGNWCQTLHNGTTSTLWYSTTSLGGAVNLTGGAWTQVDAQTVSGVTSSGIHPVLTGLSFNIPDGATYRIAISTDANQNNYSTGSPSPNNFTVSGMTLYTGDHQFVSGQNVGYASSNNPRYFTGYITFEPAIYGGNNAGVSDLTSPVPTFCSGNLPVRVQIRNNGVNTINNVDIDWELDNVPQTTVTYSNPIPSGATAEVTLSASTAFTSTPRDIKAWTTMPNGVVDTVNGDDTLKRKMGAGLNGVYIVGASGDFPNVVDAADALNQFGVCGPVTMNILPGTYTGAVTLNNIGGVSATNTITFKSQSGDASDVVINASPSGAGAVWMISDVSYVTVKDVTIASLSNNAGRVVEFTGGSSYDTLSGCIINSTGISSNSNTSGIYGVSLTGGNLVITNNEVNGGYYGIRIDGVSTSNKTSDNIIDDNIINGVYYYSSYFYYTDDLKFRNNRITALNTPTTHYGMYTRYCDGALHIIGNEITITGTSTGTLYGLYGYYDDGTAAKPGIILNNSIAVENGTSTARGIYNYYSKYQNFVNNSVSVTTTAAGSWAGRFYYTSSTYSNNKIFNNAFYYSGGTDYTLYIYRVGYNNEWDYNNIYSASNKLVEMNTPASTFNTLAAWQTAEGQDMHSISYDPGFTSITDLRPDPNNPASWSLNGRAVHINGNTSDLENNTRIDVRQNGVPDIGAFEFTPEVLPPVATATPSNADQGITQVFTFGEREVGRVKWGTRAPVGQLEVRQYSGEKGANIVADASPAGTMYFHTDITSLGNADAYDVDLNIDYMDIWLGDINNEADLRMAHKVSKAYSWSVYNNTLSSSDAISNDIDAESIHRFGSFTGLKNGAIPSAFVRPNGRVLFCIGDTVQLNAEPMNGSYYKWYMNGNAIAGAEGPAYTTYTATQAASYSVAITFNGKIVESVPLPISTVAAPNAVIAANGPLTYCTGNGLTLNAGTTQGVSYQWQLDGQNIAGATSSSYAVQQAGNYSVIVENIGCASASALTPVTAGPLDVSLGNDTTFCEQPDIFATLDAGYPGARYAWSTGDTTRTIEVKRSGNYSVLVDGGPNCIDRDTIVVNIDPLPSASGISFVQNGNKYEFFASGLNAVDAYEWIFSDGSTSTDQTPEKTITGDLYVRVVLYNACGRDTIQLGWPLTVDNVSTGDDIVVYPNPASNNLNVQLGNTQAEQLLIYNNVGAVVKQVNDIDGNKVTVNVSNLAAGNYTIHIATEAGVVTRKFNIIR